MKHCQKLRCLFLVEKGAKLNWVYESFHLSRLTGNVAGKLCIAYLRYQNRQLATRFPLTATVAMMAIPVLPVKWKAPLVFRFTTNLLPTTILIQNQDYLTRKLPGFFINDDTVHICNNVVFFRLMWKLSFCYTKFKGGWVSCACKHQSWTSGLTSQYSVKISLKFTFMHRQSPVYIPYTLFSGSLLIYTQRNELQRV